MSRGTEAVKAKILSRAGSAVGPITDKARTQQGRGLRIRVALGNGQAIMGVRDGILGITTLARVAGEFRLIAQILHARAAIPADAAGVTEPGHPHTLAHLKLCD